MPARPNAICLDLAMPGAIGDAWLLAMPGAIGDDWSRHVGPRPAPHHSRLTGVQTEAREQAGWAVTDSQATTTVT